ncbi:hypothetical protein DFP72DRAFT_855422 [Ephemerocybe angulata]|uniref:Uncharacterized protein n=1 Tax=Ephemerocybe angulata TaxID=980116 RepID=A0A8H6HHC4_9AGAR|nr:hypothetical protein DFP72DRAFT_855422 [Tulosesus angulatus]
MCSIINSSRKNTLHLPPPKFLYQADTSVAGLTQDTNRIMVLGIQALQIAAKSSQGSPQHGMNGGRPTEANTQSMPCVTPNPPLRVGGRTRWVPGRMDGRTEGGGKRGEKGRTQNTEEQNKKRKKNAKNAKNAKQQGRGVEERPKTGNHTTKKDPKTYLIIQRRGRGSLRTRH